MKYLKYFPILLLCSLYCLLLSGCSFQNKEDIMNVDGIKQGTYDKIKDNISVQ